MHAVHEVDALRYEIARQVAMAVPRLLSSLLTRKQRPQGQQAANADQMARFLSSMAKR